MEVTPIASSRDPRHGKEADDALDGIKSRIKKGEFVAMVGHSGCGKSTLLNIIAGLEQPSDGAVILDGKEIGGPGLDRMVVFQNFSLLPWSSVYENIRLAVRAAYPHWDRDKIHDYVQLIDDQWARPM